MITPKILQLKIEGHNLIEEYASLDTHRIKKFAIQHAYEKLATKLPPEHNTHFGMMTTEKEVIEVNAKLKRMIKKRKEKIVFLSLDKIKVAPNVMELQKMAGELNKK